MINNISEGVLRVASKVDPASVIHEREVNQQTANQLREARPVEKSDSGNQADSKENQNEEGSSKYLIEKKRVVFEKYNKNGELILRIPPSKKPVDEVA